ncbi:hypothetical protein PF010_g27018 [Phytophthora fragariae]|uniref:Uncharacterized protein n=1 Tax=Phytophthora fragariae TaxID=53985 RepID=A0A6G0JW30_9STRA|nr:hypothetical protein PF010_g27018 [Phytophthora fragariae]
MPGKFCLDRAASWHRSTVIWIAATALPHASFACSPRLAREVGIACFALSYPPRCVERWRRPAPLANMGQRRRNRGFEHGCKARFNVEQKSHARRLRP